MTEPMTPSQAAQEKPTSPRTADQRTSIYRMREWLSTFGPDAVIYDGTWRVGRPIDLFERALTEREAAAATPSLQAACGCGANIRCEYHRLARLDEGSATPTENDDE